MDTTTGSGSYDKIMKELLEKIEQPLIEQEKDVGLIRITPYGRHAHGLRVEGLSEGPVRGMQNSIEILLRRKFGE
ncbi:hypothetical protein MBAV_003186, partial [Candidatus Magnetobacterium bavaricum]